MQKNILTYLRLMLLLFLLINLNGCVTQNPEAYRFYQGPAAPADKASLIVAVNHCYIRYMCVPEKKQLWYFMNPSINGFREGKQFMDVPYGKFSLGIYYDYFSFDSSGTVKKTGSLISVDINVIPGEVYVVYPEIINNISWRLIVVNLRDYNESVKNNPSKKSIQRKITEYLSGSRLVMTGHTFDSLRAYEINGQKYNASMYFY
jgi:hypothetical protein